MIEQQINNQQVLRKVFELSVHPLNPLVFTGRPMHCADGQMRQCYPVISAWKADYFKNIPLHSNKQPHWLVWEALNSSVREGNSSLWQLRYYWLSCQKMMLATWGEVVERQDTTQCLEDRAVGTSEGILWNIKSISPIVELFGSTDITMPMTMM